MTESWRVGRIRSFTRLSARTGLLLLGGQRPIRVNAALTRWILPGRTRPPTRVCRLQFVGGGVCPGFESKVVSFVHGFESAERPFVQPHTLRVSRRSATSLRSIGLVHLPTHTGSHASSESRWPHAVLPTAAERADAPTSEWR